VGKDLGSSPLALDGSHPLDLDFQTLTGQAVDLDAPTGQWIRRKICTVAIMYLGKI
jgi:hypothetical protein